MINMGKKRDVISEVFKQCQEKGDFTFDNNMVKTISKNYGLGNPFDVTKLDDTTRFPEVLALMLLLLLKRKLHTAGVKLSLEKMLEELSEVQLSVIKFYDVDKRLCLLNVLNEEQKAMFGVLDLMRYNKLVSTKLH